MRTDAGGIGTLGATVHEELTVGAGRDRRMELEAGSGTEEALECVCISNNKDNSQRRVEMMMLNKTSITLAWGIGQAKDNHGQRAESLLLDA